MSVSILLCLDRPHCSYPYQVGQKLGKMGGQDYLHHREIGPYRDSYSRDQLNVNVTRLRIGEIEGTKEKVHMSFDMFFGFLKCGSPRIPIT